MKKMPILILIPMIAIIIAVGVAVAIRLLSSQSAMPAKAGADYPNPLESTQESKPSTFLGKLLGGATPSPTPATAVDFSNELKATYDDGGQSDLDSLDTSGL